MGNGSLKGKRIFVGFNRAGAAGAYSFTRVLRKQGIKIDFWGFADTWIKDPPDVVIKIYRSFFRQQLQGLLLFTNAFFKYDIFHFYSRGSFFPRLSYKYPNRLEFFLINAFNKKIVVDFRGSEAFDVIESIRKEKENSPYYEIYKDKGPDFFRRRNLIKNLLIKHADAVVLAGPWLVDSVSKYDFIIPYSRDINQIRSYRKRYKSNKDFTILHAPTNQELKGSRFLIEAVEKLNTQGLNVTLIIADKIDREKLYDLINRADVVVDQLLLGWYGGFAVEAMALGKPVISFLKHEYRELVPFGKEIPIINANKDNLVEVLKGLIAERKALPQVGEQGYKFVKRFHDSKVIANQYRKVYERVV